MLKEKAPQISRRAFLTLAAITAAGIAANEIGKRLSFFQPISSPEFSQKDLEELKDVRALLLFFSGGGGYTSLEKDPGWQEMLLKIKKELESRGYKTKILEDLRRRGPFSPLFASPENSVKKIQQLLESVPGVKIVLAGRSTAASFIEQILKVLPENNQILAIEAGRPFENISLLAAPKRTLVIENPQSDAIQEGNIWGILKDLSTPSVFLGEGVDFGIEKLRVNWQFPGHDECCSWTPEITKSIKGFLDIYFPPKK